MRKSSQLGLAGILLLGSGVFQELRAQDAVVNGARAIRDVSRSVNMPLGSRLLLEGMGSWADGERDKATAREGRSDVQQNVNYSPQLPQQIPSNQEQTQTSRVNLEAKNLAYLCGIIEENGVKKPSPPTNHFKNRDYVLFCVEIYNAEKGDETCIKVVHSPSEKVLGERTQVLDHSCSQDKGIFMYDLGSLRNPLSEELKLRFEFYLNGILQKTRPFYLAPSPQGEVPDPLPYLSAKEVDQISDKQIESIIRK